MATVRGQCTARDGHIHTDSDTKLVTMLLYTNRSWECASARLRLLRSTKRLDDYAAEVPAAESTLVIFRNAPNAWHGFAPFHGQRRVIQVNWCPIRASWRARRHVTASVHFSNVSCRSAPVPLRIETFRNDVGGSAVYKALSHPLAAPAAHALIERLCAGSSVAIYDPDGIAAAFDTFYPLAGAGIAHYFVQNVDHLTRNFRGVPAEPVTAIAAHRPQAILVASFDPAKTLAPIRHILLSRQRY